MAENSGIEWTDHTFNPWRGCQKVSPGCEHCYAETLSHRNPGVLGEWGPPHATARPVAAESYWAKPLTWNRKAEAAGRPARVFVASLADVFEDAPQVVDARARLFDLMESTPWLIWLVLTKRPENATRMAPLRWTYGWPDNVWLGTSIEDQQRAEERIHEVLSIPASGRFLSCEPLLGPVDLTGWLAPNPDGLRLAASMPVGIECRHGYDVCPTCDGDPPVTIDWVIVGGESGPGARPMHPRWARDLRDQCVAAGVPFLFKQWGAWAETGTSPPRPADPHVFEDGTIVWRVGKKAAGRELDGRTWDEIPELVVPA